MPFTAAVLAHSPDADPALHRSVDRDRSLHHPHRGRARPGARGSTVARELVAEHGVQSLLLCPGHTNQDVGEIAAAVGESVSRLGRAAATPRSGRAAAKAMEEAGWSSPRAPRG